jgi:HAD superfamily hydrolase (TIGR01450 family)
MTDRCTLDDTDGQPLVETTDGLLVDLDGVVVLGDRLVDGAGEALEVVREAGLPVAFVTNNAARRPAELVERLTGAAVSAHVDEVVTAAQAAAGRLATDLPAGASVLVVGGSALHEAVEEAGLAVQTAAEPTPAAVVQGWGPDVGWRDLAEATVALRAGARWVVTNRDRTLPTARGALPGSGALVAAVALTLGREPDLVVGKPERGLFDLARRRLGDPGRPLMVGDRLDTDIGGARRAGIPALLVLSGVAAPADLLAAAPDDRPAFVGRDLRALLDSHPPVHLDGAAASCRGVCVQVTDGGIEVSGTPDGPSDGLDGLRAAAALAWSGRLDADLYDDVVARLDLD